MVQNRVPHSFFAHPLSVFDWFSGVDARLVQPGPPRHHLQLVVVCQIAWDPYAPNEFVTVGADAAIHFWLIEEHGQKVNCGLKFFFASARKEAVVASSKICLSWLNETKLCFQLFYLVVNRQLLPVARTTTEYSLFTVCVEILERYFKCVVSAPGMKARTA